MQVDWNRIKNVLRQNAFDESLHPRDPKGESTGGQFTAKGGETMDDKKKIIYDAADRFNFPRDKVVFEDQRNVSGDGYEIAAVFRKSTGEIIIYKGAMDQESDQLGGIIAHEVNHAKMDNGTIAMAIREVIGEPVSDQDTVWGSLRRLDGVTPYSTMMWKLADDDKSFRENIAVRETLAEVARLNYLKRLNEVDPVWQDIFSEANRRVMR